MSIFKHKAFVYTLFILGLLILWEWSANNSNNTRLLISSPSLVLQYTVENLNSLLLATYTTFLEAFLGLLIATAFSFITMVLCFYFENLLKYILPIMIFSQVIPLITLAPLFIILAGIGLESKIMMAALICYFPIFVNFSNGVKLIHKNIKELFFIYGASIKQKIRYMFFPLALPNIISGLKIASTLSIIGAIVAEFNGADLGLGKNLFLAAKRLEPELMMSSLLLSSLLGGFLYLSIVLIEKKVGKWYLY